MSASETSTSSLPDADEVLVEQIGGVLLARLNRPAKRNAINGAMRRRLLAVAQQADEDSTVRVGVLMSSTAGLFCAGADLAAMAAGEFPAWADGQPPPSFARISRTTPWIAVVDGPVLGGGLELALSCELIVAAEGARFGLPEVKRGVLAAGGGVFRLPRAVPRAIAYEMLLTGDSIDAARAFALGLINRVVRPAELLEAALQLAKAVSDCAPLSLAETLAIARVANEESEAALWTRAREALTRLLSSADAKEGMAAFLAKRPAKWTGC